MNQFEDLIVWQRSKNLCCNIMKHFRAHSDYCFRDQIIRAALSIPSNLAEGHERRTIKDSNAFFWYAKGSSGEVRCQLRIAAELEYVNKSKAESWIKECSQISSMIYVLIQRRSELNQGEKTKRKD